MNIYVKFGNILSNCMELESMGMIHTGFSVLVNGNRYIYTVNLENYKNNNCKLHNVFALSIRKLT
jgi:hypothetical protein